MILTGRAKEEFLSWYGTGEHYFTTTLEPIEQYANIIGWLDSVGIYTDCQPWPFIDIKGNFEKTVFIVNVWDKKIAESKEQFEDDESENIFYDYRQQATEAAIKLANTIFNNKA